MRGAVGKTGDCFRFTCNIIYPMFMNGIWRGKGYSAHNLFSIDLYRLENVHVLTKKKTQQNATKFFMKSWFTNWVHVLVMWKLPIAKSCCLYNLWYNGYGLLFRGYSLNRHEWWVCHWGAKLPETAGTPRSKGILQDRGRPHHRHAGQEPM